MSENTLMALINTADQAIASLFAKHSARDLEALGTKYLRYPKLKIGHSNQTFSLPNNEVSREVVGFIIDFARFMELYEKTETDDENKAPLCAAIGPNGVGFKHGECAACPHYVWREKANDPTKKFRDCAESYRVLLAIKGQETPVELKVPQTSVASFRKSLQDIMSRYRDVPIELFNVTIKLVGKKEGQQEWSLFEFSFAPMDIPEGDVGRALKRVQYRADKGLNYFIETYGGMNTSKTAEAAVVVESAATKSNGSETLYDKVSNKATAKTAAAPKAKAAEAAADIADAVVSNIEDAEDLASENSQLSDLNF